MRTLKMLLLAGCLSFMATPASAIPFGINAVGGLGGWSVWNNGVEVANDEWLGAGSTSFHVDPGIVSWGIGAIFCPCSWWVSLDGVTIAGDSTGGYGLFNTYVGGGHTIAGGGDEAALQVREPATLALLIIGLLGVWFSTRRRLQVQRI